MELQHFSHEHSLIFNEVSNGYFWCDGCGEEIKGSRYSCSECNFDLHKSCAELPCELQHPIHWEHPLILHKTAPYNGKTCTCNGCKSPCKWFVYHCSLCNFDLDIKCVSLPLTVKTEIHEQPLNLFGKNSSRMSRLTTHKICIIIVIGLVAIIWDMLKRRSLVLSLI